jgi:type IV fimbrial biogenesis protein FimT
LVVVVAIAAILAAVAVPSLQSAIQANELDTVSNQLLAALATARSEAVRAPDARVQVINPTGAVGDWKGGWTTTIQTDPTGAKLPTILKAPASVPGQVTVMSNFTAGAVAFDAMGRVIAGAVNPPPTLVFIICADGTTLAGKSRAVIVSPSGRTSLAHIATSGANAGVPQLDTGAAVPSCTPADVPF